MSRRFWKKPTIYLVHRLFYTVYTDVISWLSLLWVIRVFFRQCRLYQHHGQLLGDNNEHSTRISIQQAYPFLLRLIVKSVGSNLSLGFHSLYNILVSPSYFVWQTSKSAELKIDRKAFDCSIKCQPAAWRQYWLQVNRHTCLKTLRSPLCWRAVKM